MVFITPFTPRVVRKDLRLKCLKKRRAQELTESSHTREETVPFQIS